MKKKDSSKLLLNNKGGVYVITNIAKTESNQYVGITNNFYRRWCDHKSKALHPKKQEDKNKVLYRAIRKYGVENFVFEILEEIEDFEINTEFAKQREVFWIEKLNTYYNGYNETFGGDWIGKKNVHLGENHPMHVFTEDEVRFCRKCYVEKKRRMDIYKKFFSDRPESAFSNMWFGRSWKWVMPEVFENNPYPRQKVTPDLVIRIKRCVKLHSEKTLSLIYRENFKNIIGWSTYHDIISGKRYKEISD